MIRTALVIGILVGLLNCGGEIPDPTETASQAATAAAGTTLTPIPGSRGGWGFNPACVFPGTDTDPGFFTAASVGGTLTIAGALYPQNNGTFKITRYIKVGDYSEIGNVFTSAPCLSETFPAGATVVYAGP